jgi:hypothetical protein
MSKPNALGLVPNEIVGYRIRTDEHNYTLVLVKRHGESSKFAGQTYDTVLSYHKKLEHVVDAMIERIVRMRSEGEALDEQTNGEAWALRLKESIEYAKAETIAALKELLK